MVPTMKGNYFKMIFLTMGPLYGQKKEFILANGKKKMHRSRNLYINWNILFTNWRS